jgi:hypothetical protein
VGFLDVNRGSSVVAKQAAHHSSGSTVVSVSPRCQMQKTSETTLFVSFCIFSYVFHPFSFSFDFLVILYDFTIFYNILPWFYMVLPHGMIL